MTIISNVFRFILDFKFEHRKNHTIKGNTVHKLQRGITTTHYGVRAILSYFDDDDGDGGGDDYGVQWDEIEEEDDVLVSLFILFSLFGAFCQGGSEMRGGTTPCFDAMDTCRRFMSFLDRRELVS